MAEEDRPFDLAVDWALRPPTATAQIAICAELEDGAELAVGESGGELVLQRQGDGLGADDVAQQREVDLVVGRDHGHGGR